MGRRIKVDNKLRARDVPPGTRVTPRGAEYAELGMMGGLFAGFICTFYMWDPKAQLMSLATLYAVLKVVGASTAGSLLGTFISWGAPGTLKRKRVIKELKVYLKEERIREEEGLPERPILVTSIAGPPIPDDPRDRLSIPDEPPTSSLRSVSEAEYSAGAGLAGMKYAQFVSQREESSGGKYAQYVSQREEAITPEPLPYGAKPLAKPKPPVEVERVQVTRVDGNPDALLAALEEFGHGLHKYGIPADEDPDKSIG